MICHQDVFSDLKILSYKVTILGLAIPRCSKSLLLKKSIMDKLFYHFNFKDYFAKRGFGRVISKIKLIYWSIINFSIRIQWHILRGWSLANMLQKSNRLFISYQDIVGSIYINFLDNPENDDLSCDVLPELMVLIAEVFFIWCCILSIYTALH